MLLRAFIAMLTLLIGGALVWAVATGFDGPGSQRVTSPKERKAVRIERRLGAAPTNPMRLLATMSGWLGAGSERLGRIDTKNQPIPEAVVEDYEAGLRAWHRYLRQAGGDARVEAAETASVAFFELVEIGSPDPSAVTGYVAGAVRAQKIVCEREPNSFTLNNLASYQYFNGEYAAGDLSAERALQYVARSRRGIFVRLMRGHRERGERFVARVRRGFETLEETGEEELPEPIKGYGSPAGINGYEPGTATT